MMYTASCLCGGVQLKLLAPLQPIRVCHCWQCQKAQGTAFAAITVIQTNNLRITQGENLLQEYYATPLKKRVFCRQCGSPIFSARLDQPDVVRLRIGIINPPFDVHIISHAYVSQKANWHVIGDDAAQFLDALPST
ncbi:aldehyde-activating protein [Serratia sp. S1B]|nr:aldehyde-activating protein [Serratia sp. S1B]